MRLLALAALPGLATAAAAAIYTLPPERDVALPRGPGRELTAAHCSACHSLDYITTQPPGMGARHWGATVEKMVTVFGAEIPPAERAAIEAYLARAFP